MKVCMNKCAVCCFIRSTRRRSQCSFVRSQKVCPNWTIFI